ncbi:asparagine synthase-related protein [Pedomonas sp. V897]|uniref:asparagine synthase-related protein n=1 Tax=Pedomonas sp. V897 TaxID=3446482 RepID=UPI003EE1468F
MIATSRFLLWLPRPGKTPDPAWLRRWQSVAARAGLEAVEWGPLRLAVAPGPAPRPQPPAVPIAVLDAWPLRLPHLPAATGPVDVRWAERHAQMFNLLRWDGRQLTVESDAIGLKPAHVAETADGWLMASAIADILACEPALARPVDPVAIQFLFIGRGIWEDRTVHQQVRRLKAGAVYRWTPDGGLSVTRERRWQLPVPEPAMSWDDFRRQQDAQITRLMDQTLADRPEPLALSLSGGYDSRLLASEAAARGVRPLALTFGAAHTREARAAAEIARILGLPHRSLPYRRDIILGQLDRLSDWFEGCVDVSLGQAAAVEDFGLPPLRMIQGFAGDVIAGSFTARLKPGDDASLDAIARSIVGYYWPTAPDFAGVIGLPADREALEASVRADLGDDSPPVSAFIRWCWEDHLRRYTCGLLVASQSAADLLMPYYDLDYVTFWARVPMEGLRHRAWFKRWFAERHPELGQVPHPEALDQMIAQTQPARAVEWVGRQCYKVAERLLGTPRLAATLRALGRTTYIYDGPNLTSRWHQQQIFQMMEDYRPILRQQFGLELQPDYIPALTDKRGKNTQPARMLLTLAAYAGHLHRTLAPEDRTVQPAERPETARQKAEAAS